MSYTSATPFPTHTCTCTCVCNTVLSDIAHACKYARWNAGMVLCCTWCIKISHVLSVPINLAYIASATIVLDLHRRREGYLSCPFSPHRLWRVKQDLPVSPVSKLTAWRGPRLSLVNVELDIPILASLYMCNVLNFEL